LTSQTVSTVSNTGGGSSGDGEGGGESLSGDSLVATVEVDGYGNAGQLTGIAAASEGKEKGHT